MNVGFIGAGKVGLSMAKVVSKTSPRHIWFYGRHFDEAYKTTKEHGFEACDNLKDMVVASDVIGITVQDDHIEDVVQDLIRLNVSLEEKLIFHTSGAHDVSILKPLKAHIFSLHPLKAFPRVVDDVLEFENVYFSLESADPSAKQWVDTLGILSFEIDSKDKKKYHAGAAIVSNYLVAVLDFGIKQFMQIGLDEQTAQKALWPLIMGSLNNIERFGTQSALTGPLVRGDINTIKKHLEVLDTNLQPLYKQLGLYTLSMTHHDDETRLKLETLLKEGIYE